MKSFFLVSLFMISGFSFAQTSDALLGKCFKPAKRYYYQHAGPSDTPRNFSKLKVLKANENLVYGNKTVANYDSDKLVYSASGSYYSGYFMDYIVVNPSDCEVEDLINVYSE